MQDDNKNKWRRIPDIKIINKTMDALKTNGFIVHYVEDEQAAVKKVHELLPRGAEVLNNSSTTLIQLGIADEIMESGNYNSLKKKFMSMDRKTQGKEMQMLGSAPDYAIGSVHAITEDGKVFIASASGSQLPGYAYGAVHVIWVVGVQKIVKNQEEAMERIYEYVLPLESERAKKAYGVAGSNVNKLLVCNKEPQPGRVNIVFVNKELGF